MGENQRALTSSTQTISKNFPLKSLKSLVCGFCNRSTLCGRFSGDLVDVAVSAVSTFWRTAVESDFCDSLASPTTWINGKWKVTRSSERELEASTAASGNAARIGAPGVEVGEEVEVESEGPCWKENGGGASLLIPPNSCKFLGFIRKFNCRFCC